MVYNLQDHHLYPVMTLQKEERLDLLFNRNVRASPEWESKIDYRLQNRLLLKMDATKQQAEKSSAFFSKFKYV